LDAVELGKDRYLAERTCTDTYGWLLLSVIVVTSTVAKSTEQDLLIGSNDNIHTAELYDALVWMTATAFAMSMFLVLALRGWTECTIGPTIVGGLAAQIVLIVMLLLNNQWFWMGAVIVWLVVSIAILACHQRQP